MYREEKEGDEMQSLITLVKTGYPGGGQAQIARE
jgi:hypothetical protein